MVFSECSRAHLRRGADRLDGFPNRVLKDAATLLAGATPLAPTQGIFLVKGNVD
jgi:hypothetical protein